MNMNFPSTIPTLTIGGRVFTDLVNLIVMKGFLTTGAYTGFAVSGSLAAYQVPSGKQFYCKAIEATSAAANTLYVGYSSGVPGFNSVGAPAGFLNDYNNSNNLNIPNTSGGNNTFQISSTMIVPSLYYPVVADLGATAVGLTLYGYTY